MRSARALPGYYYYYYQFTARTRHHALCCNVLALGLSEDVVPRAVLALRVRPVGLVLGQYRGGTAVVLWCGPRVEY